MQWEVLITSRESACGPFDSVRENSLFFLEDCQIPHREKIVDMHSHKCHYIHNVSHSNRIVSKIANFANRHF